MKTAIFCLSTLAVAAAAMPLAAQSTAPAAHPTTTVHHTAVHSTAAHSACTVLPTISSKVPALASTLPCAKPLYTITRTPDTKVDYVSPLVSPEVRESLGSAASTYSLSYVDVTVGTGELVKAGKFLSVKYTGYLTDGTKFDSSVDRGSPITFPQGVGKVIPGWDTGFEGMHVGGKRRLYIPYELAYGDAGRPPVIPAKSELVFDMELVSISDKQPEPPAKPTPTPRPAPKPATPATTATPTPTPTPTPAEPKK